MAQKEGSIVHVEFHSADPTRTKQFYQQVFGWKFQEIPEMNYALFQAPSPPHGGLQKHGEGRGPTVMNYVLSKSINATLPKIQAAGGSILVPKSEIPGQGWWAVFQEPGGTVMSLYENMPKPRAPAPKKAAKRKAKKAGRRRKR